MKLLIAAFAVLSSIPAFAQYTPRPPGAPMFGDNDSRVSPSPIDHYPDRDIPGHAPRQEGNVIATCAPEVVEGNVTATDRTLAALARSPEFASATQFRSVVSRVAAMPTGASKVARYFSLIGVDSKNSAAVADFVGARSVDSRWTSALERNAGLTPDQASKVAGSLQSALRGSLQ